jgi:hypothetical protein
MPNESRARRVLTACLLLLAVAACSARPFVVAAPKALAPRLSAEQAAAVKVGNPTPRLLALCYSRTLNSPEEVLAEASYECAEGEVTYLDSDLFWTPCGLLQPVRASFLCLPSPSAE